MLKVATRIGETNPKIITLPSTPNINFNPSFLAKKPEQKNFQTKNFPKKNYQKVQEQLPPLSLPLNEMY